MSSLHHNSRHFVIVSLLFFIVFTAIVFISQLQALVYFDYDLFFKIKNLKAILCLATLFYLSFLSQGYLGTVLRWNRAKWHTPAVLCIHCFEAVALSYIDNQTYWPIISGCVLVVTAVICFLYLLSKPIKLKRAWFLNIAVGSLVIFSCIYAFSLNINFQVFSVYNFGFLTLVVLSSSVMIMVSLLLLSHLQQQNREIYAAPLVLALVGLLEITGRTGFVVWWGAVLLHGFLFYLIIVTVIRLNQAAGRIMNMYRQGLDTNTTAYFCGSLDGEILFANQAYRALVGAPLGYDIDNLPHVLLEHPLWPEIKEKFCTRGHYKAETVINPVGRAPLSVAINIKPLHPEKDWYQVSLTDLESRIEIQKKRDIALEKLEQLSKELMEKQEEERRYFAKELHDEIGQGLTLLKIQHQLPETDKELITHVLDELLESVRNLSLNLRPSILDDMGISAALVWLVDRQEKFSQLKVRANIAENIPRLDEKVEISIFRIAQEAFTNIHKYAKAEKVELEASYDGQSMQLKIADDGVGFDVDAKLNFAIKSQSLGLVSIRERAFLINGELTIESSPESGTQIYLNVPIGEKAMQITNTRGS